MTSSAASADRDDAALAAAALAAFRAALPDETAEMDRAGGSVETITRGWDSLALLVGGRWIVRAARRTEVDTTLALEAWLLPLIASAVAPVRVPNFAFTRLDAPPAVLGYERIPGQPLSDGFPIWRMARLDALIADLAAFLTALHRIPTERAIGAGLTPVTVEDWLAEYATFRDWSLTEVAPLLAPELRPRLERFWAGYLDDPASARFTPVLIHRDLACEHVLLGPVGALVGVIDWGDMALGDPAMDVAGFYQELGPRFARQVIARWDGPRAPGETDAALLARAAFYADLGPLHAIRFGLMTGSSDHTRNGLTHLTRALTARE